MHFTTTAFVFPGQGSQTIGMASDLAAHSPAARAVLEQADQILGFAFTDIMRNGPAETLDDTLNTQPALYIAGVAAYRALLEKHSTANSTENGGDTLQLRPLAMAGHSLGEFTALHCAGSLEFADGLRLVRTRAQLMQQAGTQAPGAMAALLGLDVETARTVCLEASTQTGARVVVANDNCPGQIVISGDESALDAALPIAKASGAKRAIKLQVSVAAHSPLMTSAQIEFRAALDNITFHTPRCPIIGNTTAAPLTTPDMISTELANQLTGAVRWTESVLALRALGVTTCIELGSKDVLSGLIRRIDKDLTAIPVYNMQGLVEGLSGDGSNVM